jgi:hypothetical protein
MTRETDDAATLSQIVKEAHIVKRRPFRQKKSRTVRWPLSDQRQAWPTHRDSRIYHFR